MAGQAIVLPARVGWTMAGPAARFLQDIRFRFRSWERDLRPVAAVAADDFLVAAAEDGARFRVVEILDIQRDETLAFALVLRVAVGAAFSFVPVIPFRG